MRNQSSGFTLIELIIVIVILGILAVTAAPRFLDFSTDANEATLQGMAGAMGTAGQLVYAKALIQGLHNDASEDLDLNGDGNSDIEIEYGFPSDSRTSGITLALGDNFSNEWAWSTRLSPQRVVLTTATLSSSGAGQKVNNVPITTGNCYITYIAPTSAGELPSIELTTSGC